MKIIVRPKHSNLKTVRFENKAELVEYAQLRKAVVTGGLTEAEENFKPSNKSTIYELLEYCHLELVKEKK